jgi:hypothetical protein
MEHPDELLISPERKQKKMPNMKVYPDELLKTKGREIGSG